jgi:hypothetical protein
LRNVYFREHCEERWKCEKTTHHALVVAKKQEIKTCYYTNSPIEVCAAKAVEFLAEHDEVLLSPTGVLELPRVVESGVEEKK